MNRTRMRKRRRRRINVNCGRAFINGSLHRTYQRTTTLRVQLISNAPHPGFFKGASFGHGKKKEGIRYF